MAETELQFQAYGAYVRKVFRNDEDDDGDKGTPGRAGLRCRLWSKTRPSAVNYDKNQTYVLDLAAHPGAFPNFSSANLDSFECEAPFFTGIGNGNEGPAATNEFEGGDDYVNRVYLSLKRISNLGPLTPTFPPIPAASLPKRKQGLGPMDYEFQIFVYANDHPDPQRRNRRYLGYYAEVGASTAANVFKVKVFKFGSDTKTAEMEIDFTKTDTYGPRTTIKPHDGSSGALFLRDDLAAGVLDLPKLPPGLGGTAVPPIPVPTGDAVAIRIKARGNW